MRKLLKYVPEIVLAVAVLLPFRAGAQESPDTAEVIVYQEEDLEDYTYPLRVQGQPGDTIHMRAITLDAVSGDTVLALYTWSTKNANVATVDSLSGVVTLNRRGRAHIFPTRYEIKRILIGWFNETDPESVGFGDLEIYPGETWYGCLYGVADETHYGYFDTNHPNCPKGVGIPELIASDSIFREYALGSN